MVDKYRMEKVPPIGAGAVASRPGRGVPVSLCALFIASLCKKTERRKKIESGRVRIVFCALLALLGSSVHAIDPNTPITNTATASFDASGTPMEISSSATIISAPTAGNSPPTGLALINYDVPENGDGVAVGVLDATDSDSLDTHTFSVSDPRFIIVGDSLQLAPGTSFNFEVDTPITLDVTVVDSSNESVVVPITITILDVNEAPDSITLAGGSLDPDIPGAVVGPLTVTDPDNVDSHTFTVDDARFVVVGNELRLAPGVVVPPGPPITLLITATDKGLSLIHI